MHTTRSADSKARAKAAGEGQEVEAALFSAPMASSSSGTESAPSSTKVRLPTWMWRGTGSKATEPLWKEAARRSQLLSLTIFHVITNTSKYHFANHITIIIPESHALVNGENPDT